MPDPTGGLIVGSTVLGSAMQSRAASKASDAQSQAAQAGIEEQRRQFDEIQKLLAPYVEAGTGAIGQFGPYQEAGAAAFEQQQALAGILGPEAQQQAISRISRSPFLRNQIETGERALLQRAGATGGLRGGDMQAALMQFRPAMLQQAIEQQYGRLGGLAGTGLGVTEMLYRGGQASATGQAQMGQSMAGSIGNLLAQQGAARAGGIMGAASPFVQMLQMPMQLAGYGMATGRGPFGNLFGGTPGAIPQTPVWSGGGTGPIGDFGPPVWGGG